MAFAFRTKTLIHASFWVAALLVGIGGVLFDKLIGFAQQIYFKIFHEDSLWATAATPLLFLLSTALVVLVAPQAKGSGIPQALKAMMISLGSHRTAMQSGLISMKTTFIKITSATIAMLGGASIGREGPTVQISTAIFAWVGSRTKRVFPHTDFHSYLVAGAAAGVSAAFNTPLAGISFALEEMAEGSFARIKQTVMVSVIIAGIMAQTLVGNYLYFGRPNLESTEINIVIPAVLIGLLCGSLGGVFAKMLAYPVFEKGALKRFAWWQKALLCGVLVTVINLASGGQSAGTGYEITREFMDSQTGQLTWYFPISKFFASIFSYWSGFAGGIFSPSLAIGAGFGAGIADLLTFSQIKACSLLGMVAFFTGVVQAPLTAVIIVMEMTDQHSFIIPLMIAAFVAQGISKLLMPVSLYHHLAFSRRPE